jgi:hypothetical protein
MQKHTTRSLEDRFGLTFAERQGRPVRNFHVPARRGTSPIGAVPAPESRGHHWRNRHHGRILPYLFK